MDDVKKQLFYVHDHEAPGPTQPNAPTQTVARALSTDWRQTKQTVHHLLIVSGGQWNAVLAKPSTASNSRQAHK